MINHQKVKKNDQKVLIDIFDKLAFLKLIHLVSIGIDSSWVTCSHRHRQCSQTCPCCAVGTRGQREGAARRRRSVINFQATFKANFLALAEASSSDMRLYDSAYLERC